MKLEANFIISSPVLAKMAEMRLRGLIALLCVLVPGATAAPLGRQPKRRNSWYEPVASATEQLLARAAEALQLRTPPFVFHMCAPLVSGGVMDGGVFDGAGDACSMAAGHV